MRTMAERWRRRLLAVAASCAVASAQAKLVFAADVYFAENSVQLEARYLEKLDTEACKAVRFGLEMAIGTAHASRNEADPQGLSQRRALAVQSYLQALTSLPVVVEARGATQPVADPATRAGQAKNRRVEVDMVFTVPDQPPSPAPAPCRPQWVKHMLANARTAPVVAQAWIRDYQLAATAPFEVALREKRPDVFAALARDGGIRLTPPQYAQVAQAAWQAGELDYALDWMRQHIGPMAAAERSAWLRHVCQSPAEPAQKLRATQALYAMGVRSFDGAPLLCAVGQGQRELVRWYLQQDGSRWLDAEVVVAAGPHPAILQDLLAAGADLRARAADGSTLFFSTPLLRIADGERLQAAGLDINARRKDGATPLQVALGTAPLEVLQWMRAQGATVDAIRGLYAAEQRPEIQAWLLASGVQVPAEQLSLVLDGLVERGDASLPVLQALLVQGAAIAGSAAGRQALAQAISHRQVALVQFLVHAGVDNQAEQVAREPTALTPWERAEALDIYQRWRPCTTSVPAQWCPPEHAPILDATLALQRDQILSILQSEGASAKAPATTPWVRQP